METTMNFNVYQTVRAIFHKAVISIQYKFSKLPKCFSKVLPRVCVTIDAVWIGELTTYTHDLWPK
jgi:hypothetical protein